MLKILNSLNNFFKRFLLSALLAGPCFADDKTYTVIDLGTLGGTTSVANALNNSAQVVGLAEDADGHEHAFLWEHGSMRDLGALPGGTNSEATDINNLGEIVGHAERGEACGGDTVVTHAFLYDGLTMNDMNVASGCSSRAWGINDRSHLVGWAYHPGSSLVRGYLYRDAQRIDVDLILWSTQESALLDVNMSTQVVGTLQHWNGGNTWSPFLWQDPNGNGSNDLGEVVELGNLGTNGLFGAAWAINNGGQIVGGSDVTSYEPKQVRHAFVVNPDGGVWFRDTNSDLLNDLMTDIGTLGGDWAEALDINASGTIVGYSTLPDQSTTNAFLWENGALTNLNHLIPTNSGWILQEARAINDAGEIVGVGVVSGKVHGFLLSLPMRIYRMPSYGTDYESVWTNELSEVGTQKLQTIDGFVLHWSSGWNDKDTASVYTVEARNPHDTNDWSIIIPTSQWPILGLSWTNPLEEGLQGRVFRVRATSLPSP